MPQNAAANRYELKELLGEGGMGVVYRALDTRTNSYVALKTLRDATDPALLEMFKREWALLGEVPHPNIVDVRDVDEIEENGVRKPCFIMPLLPGCTLAKLIKDASPRLTTEFVVNMVGQVCKGLQAAHEKDLIHRDIKPSNIFIMEDDTAKIIDFGLVHAIGNKSTTGLKGTWQYMASEQVDGSKAPNRSFDIYSLGVVAYEALTGHSPFKRPKFEDTVDAIRHFVPQAISERNPRVPIMVSKAIHIAMAKLPNSRYATAREFADTLQKAFRNEYIERFDPAKIRPRIDRAKKAFALGDSEFASEILTELEAEGNLDADITLLRSQIDEFNKQKRVRQLYEAAQTRLEQDEIPLAVDKLQEILKIDPQNADALKLRKKIEQQRNDQQVAEWLDLARKHLDRHDFNEARRALKEVFNLKYDDPEAAQLKAQVDAREKEVETARAEKEHLYSTALRHNQNGEISSALSKLERLLELGRNTPDASVPERDKVFQSFYNDVRTERDRIDSAYSDGSRHLSEKEFEKALGICDGILYRYPQNPQFQALRLKIEHSQRQELSAYIAEVGRAVETEPNLDRRVGILEEACRRYPNEAQFSRLLTHNRELRDLVASIVNRARNYEEQGQFAEAITQWNTLSNIHPQYVGIDFEINQLERRREQQTQEDRKLRLVEKIDRALGNAAYADAQRLSESGLLEFPDNPELLALHRLSQQGLEQNREANRLFEEAKAKHSAGNWEHAVTLLRQALDLDKRNIVVQNTLVKLLTDHSLALLDTDPAKAEPFAAEAAHLDPEHPSVNKVIDLIAQAKRRRDVEQAVLHARELQTIHRGEAIDVVKEALTRYPNDFRLQQTLTSLQKEFVATTFGQVAPDSKTEVYQVPVNGGSVTQPSNPVQPSSPSKPPSAKQTPYRRVSTTPPAQTEPPKTPKPAEAPAGSSLGQQIRDAAGVFAGNVKSRTGGGSHKSTIIGIGLGLVASALLILLGTWYLHRSKEPPPPAKVEDGGSKPSQAKLQPFKISVVPADAVVSFDGLVAAGGMTPPVEDGSTHSLTISRVGYRTIENPSLKVTGSALSFTLDPQPLNISGSVSDKNGSVLLDGQEVQTFSDGSWSYAAPPVKTSEEHHTLAIKNGRGSQLLKIGYTVAAGKVPVVEPLTTKDLLVASSLGKDAMIYAGNPNAKLVSPEGERKPIPTDGIAVKVDTASAAFTISNGAKDEPFSVAASQAPALNILLNAEQNFAQATLTVTPASAKLFVEGPIRPRKPGVFSWQAAPGVYQGKFTADGMEDLSVSIPIKKGVPFTHSYVMTPKVTNIGPKAAFLVFTNAEPEATVSILNGPQLGHLDGRGNGRFPYRSGTYTVELSKENYDSNSFKVTLTAGKDVEPAGNKRLKLAVSYVKLSVQTPQAEVWYRRSGDNEKHKISDFSKQLTLSPGNYDFTADAPNHQLKTIEVRLDANQVKEITFDLAPLVRDQLEPVNPGDVTKENGNWYHGRNASGFIPLVMRFRTNTILFSKDFKKSKKMSWMIVLDGNNSVTYTLDAKGVSVVRRTDGESETQKLKNLDLTSSEPAPSYAIQIKLDKKGFTVTGQNGANPVDAVRDDKHDWTQAKIFIKGDTYFTVWPGR